MKPTIRYIHIVIIDGQNTKVYTNGLRARQYREAIIKAYTMNPDRISIQKWAIS